MPSRGEAALAKAIGPERMFVRSLGRVRPTSGPTSRPTSQKRGTPLRGNTTKSLLFELKANISAINVRIGVTETKVDERLLKVERTLILLGIMHARKEVAETRVLGQPGPSDADGDIDDPGKVERQRVVQEARGRAGVLCGPRKGVWFSKKNTSRSF